MGSGLRIEYHERQAWATIRTRSGEYVCTVNRYGSGSNPTRKQIAEWRRRVRAVRDALEQGAADQTGGRPAWTETANRG